MNIIQSVLCVNGIAITGVVSTDIIPQALRLEGVAIKGVVSADIIQSALVSESSPQQQWPQRVMSQR